MYIHSADIAYEQDYGCWVVTDLFSDVLVGKDNRTHTVLDLDDLAFAFELGLITKVKLTQILRATQGLIDLIREGNFPPAEVEECQRVWANQISLTSRCS